MDKTCGNCLHGDESSPLTLALPDSVACKVDGPTVFNCREGFVSRFPVMPKAEKACGKYAPCENLVSKAALGDISTGITYLNKIEMECIKCGGDVEVEKGPTNAPYYQCGCDLAAIDNETEVLDIWTRKK